MKNLVEMSRIFSSKSYCLVEVFVGDYLLPLLPFVQGMFVKKNQSLSLRASSGF